MIWQDNLSFSSLRDGEIAQLVKYCLCLHEDLIKKKKPGEVAQMGNDRAGDVEKGGCRGQAE